MWGRRGLEKRIDTLEKEISSLRSNCVYLDEAIHILWELVDINKWLEDRLEERIYALMDTLLYVSGLPEKEFVAIYEDCKTDVELKKLWEISTSKGE